MSVLTKARLVVTIEEEVGLDASLSNVLVDAFFDEIRELLQKDNKVILSGLGKFSVRQKEAREGRNPKTGEKVMVPSRKVVHFQTSASLRKLLNQLSFRHNGA